jgi:hypothetical protein
MMIRSGILTEANDMKLWQKLFDRLKIKTTIQCCTGYDYESEWAGNAYTYTNGTCQEVIEQLVAKGYKGPKLLCSHAVQWTKDGASALGTEGLGNNECNDAIANLTALAEILSPTPAPAPGDCQTFGEHCGVGDPSEQRYCCEGCICCPVIHIKPRLKYGTCLPGKTIKDCVQGGRDPLGLAGFMQ